MKGEKERKPLKPELGAGALFTVVFTHTICGLLLEIIACSLYIHIEVLVLFD